MEQQDLHSSCDSRSFFLGEAALVVRMHGSRIRSSTESSTLSLETFAFHADATSLTLPGTSFGIRASTLHCTCDFSSILFIACLPHIGNLSGPRLHADCFSSHLRLHSSLPWHMNRCFEKGAFCEPCNSGARLCSAVRRQHEGKAAELLV